MLSSRWYWRNTTLQHGIKPLNACAGTAGYPRYISYKAHIPPLHSHAHFKTSYVGGHHSRELSTTHTLRAIYDPSHYRSKKIKAQHNNTSSSSRAEWIQRIQPYLTRSFLTRLFKFAAAAFLTFHFVTIFYTIKSTYGPSMMPTISWDGDAVLISNFFHRRGRNIAVGDVINFEHPVRPGCGMIKRVVGMPGDFVCRDTPGKGQGWLVQVPEGCCWVVGDNMAASRDSRMFGPLPLALVRGKVIAAWSWPSLPRIMKNTLDDTEGLDIGAVIKHGDDEGK